MLESIVGRVRQGAQVLRQAPLFSALVVVTLAVAIAAASLAFSVVNATLLEPLPLRDVERVVALEYAYATMPAAFSPPTFADFRRASRAFDSLSACRPWEPSLTGAGDPERLRGLQVSGDFFDTLGVAAARGRALSRLDEQPGHEHVVVISDALWRSRFGGDPRLVGSSVALNGESFEIAGVMPPGFRWGRAWGRETQADVWAPYVLSPERLAEDSRGDENLDVYARRRPGVSAAQATADVASVVAALRQRFPDRYGLGTGWRVRPLAVQESIVAPLRPTLVLVFAAVATLLLLAAVNVAGLLLARAVARGREVSVRAALGASGGRLAADALCEALVLGAVGLAAGLVMAQAAIRGLEGIDRELLPRSTAFAIDLRTFGFAVGAMLLASLLSGLVPAWHACRIDLAARLRTRGAFVPGRPAARLRRALVVMQTALALALLVGAGLLVRSLAALRQVPLGFVTHNVHAARVELPPRRYDAASGLRLVEGVVADLSDRTGIAAAAAISELPLSGASNSSSFEIDGAIPGPLASAPHAETWSATPGYFAALGIPLRRGRVFQASDVGAAAPVAVVSDSLARRYFPDADPVGRRVDFEGSPGAPQWRTIVGVVGDVRDRGLDRRPEPQLYAPFAQRPTRGTFLVVRMTSAAGDATPLLRAAVKAADSELAIFDARTLDEWAQDAVRRWAVAGAALAAFAGAASFLACLGLYGLLAQSLGERRQEFGIRSALGAVPGSLVRMVLGEACTLVTQGLALGTALALAGGGLMRSLVFGVAASDPLTYASVSLLLGLAALAACWLPAWRASRVDPVIALRGD